MSYTSPVKETKFILENLLEDNAKIESDTLLAVLEEAGKLAPQSAWSTNHHLADKRKR